MAAIKDFAKSRVSGPEEWKVIREVYAETYPVRPLLNRIDQLEDALLSLLPGLVLDLRYAEPDDDRDAMQSRIDTVRDCFTDSGETEHG
jgi:hypothetical protein